MFSFSTSVILVFLSSPCRRSSLSLPLSSTVFLFLVVLRSLGVRKINLRIRHLHIWCILSFSFSLSLSHYPSSSAESRDGSEKCVARAKLIRIIFTSNRVFFSSIFHFNFLPLIRFVAPFSFLRLHLRSDLPCHVAFDPFLSAHTQCVTASSV